MSDRYKEGYVAGHRKGMEDCRAEIERLRSAALALLGDLDLHPDDEEAIRRVLEEKS